MNIIHTGLAASSEGKADRFFIDILGLKKSVPKTLEKNLTQAIFGIDDNLLIIHYRDENVDFEILVYDDFKLPEKQITHSCIRVNDLKNIVVKCKDADVKVIEVPKGAGVVTFISDYDGNLFEVKE